jgi:hypothetical protein
MLPEFDPSPLELELASVFHSDWHWRKTVTHMQIMLNMKQQEIMSTYITRNKNRLIEERIEIIYFPLNVSNDFLETIENVLWGRGAKLWPPRVRSAKFSSPFDSWRIRVCRAPSAESIFFSCSKHIEIHPLELIRSGGRGDIKYASETPYQRCWKSLAHLHDNMWVQIPFESLMNVVYSN